MAFNLKKHSSSYKPNNPDVVTEKQLLEQNKSSKNPESTAEVLLDKDRVDEKEQTIEVLLEKNRDNRYSQSTTEAMLDKNNGKFENKHRNDSSYQGNINKLEEKRLASNPVEEEKYEVLSETPKEMRWWESELDKDGTRLANSKKKA